MSETLIEKINSLSDNMNSISISSGANELKNKMKRRLCGFKLKADGELTSESDTESSSSEDEDYMNDADNNEVYENKNVNKLDKNIKKDEIDKNNWKPKFHEYWKDKAIEREKRVREARAEENRNRKCRCICRNNKKSLSGVDD